MRWYVDTMFSGKTEELLRRIKRARFANQTIELFKPAMDTRYSEEEMVSMIILLWQLLLLIILCRNFVVCKRENVEVVGIDEVQFLDRGLLESVMTR